MKLKGIIDNWGIVSKSQDAYKAPEQATTVIIGEIKDNGEIKPIQTSSVKSLKVVDGNIIAETRNSFYSLKSISKEFKKYLKDNKHSLSEYISQ